MRRRRKNGKIQCQAEPKAAANEPELKVLCEQLPHNPAPRRSQSHADCIHLAEPREAAVTFAPSNPSQRQMSFNRRIPLSRWSAAQFLLCVVIPLAVHAPALQAGAQASGAASEKAPPVLVELFTSEGCSSCPPADALLARLDATQFVPGAHAIVLSEHVTYWNYLGWRDPYSMDMISDRQQQYATHFGLSGVYTPQAVVDGAAEALGSDSTALSRAIARAAQRPKTSLAIESLALQGDRLHFSVRATASPHLVLMAALAQDAAQTSVPRGENAGHTLHHVAVVRILSDMGLDAADGRPLTITLPEGGNAAHPGGAFRLVVFLIDRPGGTVHAVAERAIAKD